MIAILLVLMPLRVPVCAVMGISAITGLIILDMPVSTLVRYMATDVRSVPLLAIPFFILAGNLMNHFDMTKRIFDFLDALVGYFNGGLAQAAVLTSLVFGGIDYVSYGERTMVLGLPVWISFLLIVPSMVWLVLVAAYTTSRHVGAALR